jgi:hypothetical protein
VQVIDRVLKLLSAVYHGILGLFCFGVGALAYATNMGSSLKLTMMPWFSGPWLSAWLLGLGAVGICLAALFFLGKLKPVFLLWAIFVLVTMVYGYFSGAHVFANRTEAWNAVYLCVGALIALIGAWRGWATRNRA